MKHLFKLILNSARNTIINLTFLAQLKISVFLVIGFVFLSGIYWISWRFLSYLNTVAVVGPLLMNKMVSLVFLSSFSMIMFSSIITSFSTIFYSKDIQWLMGTPLKARTIFSYKTLSTCFYASWMVVIALIPLFISIGHVKNTGFSFYLLSAVLLVPFLIISGTLGVLVTLTIMHFFPSGRARDIFLFLGITVVTLLYVLIRFLQPERLVRPDGLEIAAQYLNYLDAPTAVYLPSWWITGAVFSLISGNYGNVLFYSSLLFGSSFVIFYFVIRLSEKTYFSSWSEGMIVSNAKLKNRYASKSAGRFSSMLYKDTVTFFRDSNQWSQLLMLGALVIVYLFSIHKLPLESMYIQNIVSFFNIALISFILSALALRLVFPSISMEGNNIYLIKTSPVPAFKFILQKLIFNGIFVVLLGNFLILTSSILLKSDFEIVAVSLISVFIMSIGLSTLAVGFGSVFARFDLSNIAQIEASGGGIFYILTAFFYIAVNVSLWAIPVQNFYHGKFGGSKASLGSFSLVWWSLIILNLLVLTIPVIAGAVSIKNRDL